MHITALGPVPLTDRSVTGDITKADEVVLTGDMHHIEPCQSN